MFVLVTQQKMYITLYLTALHTGAVKSLLTVRVLLQQKPDSECCA